MEVPVQKGVQLWSRDGITVYATDVAGKAIMEWEDPLAFEAACRLNDLLKRHALASNFLARHQSRSILVRQLDLLNFIVTAEASPGDSSVRFTEPNGRLVERAELLTIDGLNKDRVEMMEDVAAHAVRSLRAHLLPSGVTNLRLNLHFGLTADGACLLQVINPLVCDLGTTDMEGLANLLGG